jgi:hypothetical protein
VFAYLLLAHMTEPGKANCLRLPSSRDLRPPAGLHHLRGVRGRALPDLVGPARRLPAWGLEAGWLRQGAEDEDLSISTPIRGLSGARACDPPAALGPNGRQRHKKNWTVALLR